MESIVSLRIIGEISHSFSKSWVEYNRLILLQSEMLSEALAKVGGQIIPLFVQEISFQSAIGTWTPLTPLCLDLAAGRGILVGLSTVGREP
jgi:hypothetical protein